MIEILKLFTFPTFKIHFYILYICKYLKWFYTYKTINDVFLKFRSLLTMPKITEIGQIVPAEKHDSKTKPSCI